MAGCPRVLPTTAQGWGYPANNSSSSTTSPLSFSNHRSKPLSRHGLCHCNLSICITHTSRPHPGCPCTPLTQTALLQQQLLEQWMLHGGLLYLGHTLGPSTGRQGAIITTIITMLHTCKVCMLGVLGMLLPEGVSATQVCRCCTKRDYCL
jgi:hypothetical protein